MASRAVAVIFTLVCLSWWAGTVGLPRSAEVKAPRVTGLEVPSVVIEFHVPDSEDAHIACKGHDGLIRFGGGVPVLMPVTTGTIEVSNMPHSSSSRISLPVRLG